MNVRRKLEIAACSKGGFFARLCNAPLAIVLLFFLFTLPFSFHYQLYYPDEMYYTDGALTMQQDGDFLTPKHWSGSSRFNKPILTYYVVLAGHTLFGTSPFSSRIFFLIAGACTVLLVFFAAETINGNKKTALLSAMIAASHPTIILSSTRSIPDILLALFLSLSVLGLAGIIRFGNKVPVKYLWFFYLGLALAFSVKGLPAVALGGLAWLFLLMNPWGRISFRTLWHWPSVLVSLGVAFWWFAAMYSIHGVFFLGGFLGDQVGVRMGSAWLRSLFQFGLALVLVVALFFPWFVFLPWKRKKIAPIFSEFSSGQKSFFILVIIWVVAIVIMSALVTKFYERYLLPVVPAMAIALAMSLVHFDFGRHKMSWILLRLLNGINVLIVALALLISVILGATLLNWVILIISVCVLVLSFSKQRVGQYLPQWVSINVLLILFVSSILTSLISLPGMGEQAKQFIAERHEPITGTVAFSGNQYHGSRIRLGLGLPVRVDNFEEGTGSGHLQHYAYCIVDEKIKNEVDHTNWTCEIMTSTWEKIPAVEIFLSLFTGKFDEVKSNNQRKYYWIERKDLNDIDQVPNVSQ
jgi:4-amino-4-deoxy-L-arabinose transferase-like glycosyltransferase